MGRGFGWRLFRLMRGRSILVYGLNPEFVFGNLGCSFLGNSLGFFVSLCIFIDCKSKISWPIELSC